MKKLYPKSKGKIHPSPSAAGDALAVLALLPVAALALTAALGYDDKEVVAYLITRSLNSLTSDADKKRSKKSFGAGAAAAGGQHRPTFDCGCFNCYTSFWIRWDSSQQREVIHQVIEAFEEHLASSEKSKKKGSTSRRRDRRGGSDRAPNGKEKAKGKGKKKVEELEEVVVLELPPTTTSCGDAEVKEVEIQAAQVAPEEKEVETAVEEEAADEEIEAAADGGGGGAERRKSWPDVMGIFNSRFWSLWSPGA